MAAWSMCGGGDDGHESPAIAGCYQLETEPATLPSPGSPRSPPGPPLCQTLTPAPASGARYTSSPSSTACLRVCRRRRATCTWMVSDQRGGKLTAGAKARTH